MVIGSAEIELRPEASRFGQQARSALGGGLKSLAAVAAGAMAGVGLAAVAKDAIGLEKTFSQTMNTMAAVANVPKASMKELSDLALDMGAKTVFSANESATAMLELAKGGLSAATIQAGALEGTLTLATAGGTDLATAATIAANALNTFGLAGEDMNAVAAALAGGANASTASIESLGEALGQVGPGAKNAGLSLQDTVGTLAAFDAAGIKGSDAGTSLKTMLTRLVPSTEKSAAAMRRLGLDFTDAQGNFLPITEVAQQLQDSLRGLSDEQRTQALATIFGSDATRAATVLMEQGAEGLATYIGATKDLGAAQRVADARMSGTAGALERLSGAVETAKLRLGQFLAPAIVAGADFLAGALDRLPGIAENIGDALGGVYDLLVTGDFTGRFAEAFDVAEDAPVVDLLLRVRDGLIGVYDLVVNGDFSSAFARAFNVGEDAPVVDLLLRIRDGIVDAVATAREKGPQIAAALGGAVVDIFGDLEFSGVIDQASQAALQVADAFAGVGERISERIGDIDFGAVRSKVAAEATELVQPLLDGLERGMATGDWSAFGQALGEAILKAASGLAALAGEFTSLLGDVLGGIDWVGIGLEIGKQAPSLLIGLVVGILNFDLMGLLAGLAAHWQEILFAVLTVAFLPARWITQIANLLRRIPLVGRLLGWLLEGFAGVSRSVVAAVGRFLSFLGSAFMTGFRAVFPGIGVGFGRYLALLPTAIGVTALRVQAAAVRLVMGLARGIRDRVAAVAQAVGTIVALIVRAFLGAPRWLIGHGRQVIEGLVRGVVARLASVNSAVGQARGRATAALAAAGGWLLRAGGNLIAGLIRGIGGALSGVGKRVGDAKGWVTSALSNAGSWLLSAGMDIVSGLARGISSAAGRAIQAARDLASSLPGWVKKVLGIESPSKVFAQIGRYVGEGFILGVTGTQTKIRSTMQGLAKAIVDTFENIGDTRGTLRKRIQSLGDRLDDLNRKSRTYARDRARTLADIADARRQLRALENFSAADKRTLSAMVTRENKRLLTLAKERDGIAEKLKAAQSNLTDAISARDDFAGQITDQLRGSANIVATDGIVTAGRIESQLRERLTALTRFQADLTNLVRRGLSPALIRQIAEAGVESGAATAAALANASAGELARINSVQAQVEKVTKDTGDAVAERLFGAGVASARGLVAGLQSEQKAIEKQMLKIAKAMEKAIRKALGIRSPSTVFRSLGREIPRGLDLGIRDDARRPVGRVRALSGDLASALSTSAAAALRPAITGQAVAAGGQGGTTREHHLHLQTRVSAGEVMPMWRQFQAQQDALYALP